MSQRSELTAVSIILKRIIGLAKSANIVGMIEGTLKDSTPREVIPYFSKRFPVLTQKTDNKIVFVFFIFNKNFGVFINFED